MADPSVAREWLAKADEDFLFTEANLQAAANIARMVRDHILI